MSTNPTAVGHEPIPGIETVTPVPGLVTFHERRTVTFCPAMTVLGFAEKEFMTGGGHAVTVTVTWAVDAVPQPLVAVIV